MKTALALIALFGAGTVASANTVFEDNFASGNRNGWFTFTTATTASSSVNGTNGSFTLTPQVTNGNGVSLATVTYFTPTTLGTGQSIELSFDLNYTVRPASRDTGLRFGLFNSFGSRLATDQSGTGGSANAAFNDDRGYAVFTSLASDALTHSIRERSSDNTTFWTNAAFATVGTAGTRPATAANTTFNISLLITYVDAETMSVVSTINGVEFARVDASPATATFDTFAFFTDGNNGNITISDVLVTSSIPEPSTYAALLGVTGLGLAAVRRKR